MKNRTSNKYVSIAATAFVVAVLILAGRGSAYNFGFTTEFSKTDPVQGEVIFITAELEIESDERIIPGPLMLFIDNMDDFYCSFNATSGEEMFGNCNGTEIVGFNITEIISSYGYGYGYGYTPGFNLSWGNWSGYNNVNITYNISINTSYFAPGPYDVQLRILIGDTNVTSETKNFTVQPLDIDPPEVVIIMPELLTRDDLGSPVNVEIQFDKAMNISSTVTVSVEGITGGSASVIGDWHNATVWTGNFTFSDNDEETDEAYYAVSGAEDLAGNPMAALTERGANNALDVDTLAPTASPVSITSDNDNPIWAKVGDTVTLTFNASEEIENVLVTIDGKVPDSV
ncbi:MAG TPA: hypothetical protein ENN46_03815, partial [Candidatus Woesearchaeota archaeon]|nr:hypothetical protein [Candidatus Woesearchaeota archaeon]